MRVTPKYHRDVIVLDHYNDYSKDTVGSFQNLFNILIVFGVAAIILNLGIKKPKKYVAVKENSDTSKKTLL